MDDELEMDASGCWVRKNAQVISETPLHSFGEYYTRLAHPLNVKDTGDTDKKDEIVIIL
tara:strand:- start:244 stop:420 length:177 start_codon:yes stop_codon:yes gene_type:complete